MSTARHRLEGQRSFEHLLKAEQWHRLPGLVSQSSEKEFCFSQRRVVLTERDARSFTGLIGRVAVKADRMAGVTDVHEVYESMSIG